MTDSIFFFVCRISKQVTQPFFMILFTGGRRLNKLEKDVNKLLDSTTVIAAQNNITELKTKVTGLSNDYTELKTKVTGLSNDVASTKSSITELENKVRSVEECTTLMAGVHSCRVPKYDVSTAPKDLTLKDIISPEKNYCIKIEELADVDEELFHEERLRKRVGTGDVADNYICLDKEIVKQNATALLPEQIQRYLADHSHMTVWDFQTYKARPNCEIVCKRNTCSQVDTIIDDSRQPTVRTNASSGGGVQARTFYPDHVTSKDVCATCPALDYKCAPYTK